MNICLLKFGVFLPNHPCLSQVHFAAWAGVACFEFTYRLPVAAGPPLYTDDDFKEFLVSSKRHGHKEHGWL